MVVTMTEVTFFLGAADASNLTTALICISLVGAVQHLYSIVASPALMLPLGVIIITSNVFPRVLGYLALVIGSIFAILGLVFLFTPYVGSGIAVSATVRGGTLVPHRGYHAACPRSNCSPAFLSSRRVADCHLIAKAIMTSFKSLLRIRAALQIATSFEPYLYEVSFTDTVSSSS